MKSENRTGGMAQSEKVLAAKLEDPSSVPRTHRMRQETLSSHLQEWYSHTEINKCS